MDGHQRRLHEAAAAHAAAQDELDRARHELHAAILQALAAGMKQADVVKATGYTRERIRLLSREHEQGTTGSGASGSRPRHSNEVRDAKQH